MNFIQIQCVQARTKKVEMCIDCGKPETECDCPGYEHNPGREHDHDETEESKEKK